MPVTITAVNSHQFENSGQSGAYRKYVGSTVSAGSCGEHRYDKRYGNA
jgi:hypothetical protein